MNWSEAERKVRRIGRRQSVVDQVCRHSRAQMTVAVGENGRFPGDSNQVCAFPRVFQGMLASPRSQCPRDSTVAVILKDGKLSSQAFNESFTVAGILM